MISCRDFFTIFKKNGYSFFTGIPDSTFKDFLNYLDDNNGKVLTNIIACNECESIALSAGYYLATNKIAVAYMQNSGFGKAVNPLTSLCDYEVYSIPILVLIGWRGEPGQIDAPQHKKMGRILLNLLDTLEIPYSVLKPNLKDIKTNIKKATDFLNSKKHPYALIIKRNFFQNYNKVNQKESKKYELSREDAINIIMNNLHESDIIVSTTGYTSREVYEYRENSKKDHFRSFYNIGSMGCASSIGLGIAVRKPNKRIIIFDGDGATIMQMGGFSTVGKLNPLNYIHFIFDNHVHETTGCQPSSSKTINFVDVALANNYNYGKLVSTKKELLDVLKDIKTRNGPIIIVVRVKIGHRTDLKRPENEPKYYKEQLLKFLRESK
ncbi:MAG: phosphonopyruvate decarboxylase [Candidatus Hermodarchaeota archaeon]